MRLNNYTNSHKKNRKTLRYGFFKVFYFCIIPCWAEQTLTYISTYFYWKIREGFKKKKKEKKISWTSQHLFFYVLPRMNITLVHLQYEDVLQWKSWRTADYFFCCCLLYIILHVACAIWISSFILKKWFSKFSVL